MGAPVQSWAEYATVYGEMENDQVDQTESTTTGPRREIARNTTFIARCHPSQMFSPAMRAITDDGQTLAINAVRYNAMHTIAYLDVTGGVSSGGVP